LEGQLLDIIHSNCLKMGFFDETNPPTLKRGSDPIKGLFVPASQLAFSVKKLKSQKRKQTANFSAGFWNAGKQASEEMN
jgi:hypothetical protein